MNFKEQFKEGLITQNPVTVQLLGMCSVLAVTTTNRSNFFSAENHSQQDSNCLLYCGDRYFRYVC